jgi:hypothetical protein
MMTVQGGLEVDGGIEGHGFPADHASTAGALVEERSDQ